MLGEFYAKNETLQINHLMVHYAKVAHSREIWQSIAEDLHICLRLRNTSNLQII